MPNENFTFREFSMANRKRCEAKDGFNHPIMSWSEADWLSAATGELGEVAHAVKRILRVRDGLIKNSSSDLEISESLAEEVADTVIYLDLLCQRAGIDTSEAIRKKFNQKSDQIGSPVKI